jgi:hypothetical protein
VAMLFWIYFTWLLYILYDLHRALYPGERFILPSKTKCENLGILAVVHDNTKTAKTTVNR